MGEQADMAVNAGIDEETDEEITRRLRKERDEFMADYQDLGKLLCKDEAWWEITRLREKLADWEDSARRARNESVTDEKHCACVPLLRKSLKDAEAKAVEVEEEIARLREELEDEKSHAALWEALAPDFVTGLHEDNVKLQTEIDTLRLVNGTLEETNSALKEKIAVLRENINSTLAPFKGGVEEYLARVNGLEARVVELVAAMNDALMYTDELKARNILCAAIDDAKERTDHD
jgi:predicted  nucleic acid-binding Zn-ribbon protein